ncbi:MAG: phospho-N-acetylmuramoyl-pentapeptide-transferase [Candidatus Omnitrophica bacterium]|nr:phospho-N-acetylmuramoyl-pentapeptide-transferase [Candidatus Omnitrophota bacterium]
MFFYLSQFKEFFFGFNIFRYITFRAGMAGITTFLFCLIFGPMFIKWLNALRVQEIAKRNDAPGLDKFQVVKEGTPTMGGIFIVISILISVLLWGDMTNCYILFTTFTCLYLGILGGIDDYVKLKGIGKHRGLSMRTKFMWQVLLGCFLGSYVYFSPFIPADITFPFTKIAVNIGWGYIIFAAVVIIGTSNAVNFTDGLDGLAIGCVLFTSLTLAVLCYITGHALFSNYLLLPYIPGTGELTVFCAAIAGASLGFLWFNCHPANVFMGDVGSLALGGTLGVIAVFIKKELLLPIMGGVFVLEALSVILQVASFKMTGKRIFKMAPFHHHLQLSGWKESKIIVRFWILAVIFALVALTTLKIR